MGKLLCLFALALALAPSPRARQQQDAPTPAETCDEMKARLHEAVARGDYKNQERMQQTYEAAKKLVRLCYDSDDKFTLYLAKWVEKYEKQVREFEAGRSGGALGAKAGAVLTKGVTEAQ